MDTYSSDDCFVDHPLKAEVLRLDAEGYTLSCIISTLGYRVSREDARNIINAGFPSKQAPLTENQKSLILELYETKMSVTEIAEKFHTHNEKIAKVIKGAGIKIKQSYFYLRKMSEEKAVEVIALYKEGMSFSALAKRFGAHHATIKTCLKGISRDAKFDPRAIPKGVSAKEIAQLTGLQIWAVNEILNKARKLAGVEAMPYIHGQRGPRTK